MFARVKSTVSQITNKIGFGAGWVAGYAVATGKKVTEKTSEAVKATTALTVKTVNATAKATKSATEKSTSTAKSAWQAVGKTARSVRAAVVDTWHDVGRFCLRHLEKAFWTMVVGVVLMLAVAHPAAAILVGAVLYNASLMFALVGTLYLAYLLTLTSWERSPVSAVA
jgi:hypothetical protein